MARMRAPAMTRAHYEFIAECLRDSAAPGVVMEEFARRLAETNPRFDRGRFIAAAGERPVREVASFEEFMGGGR